MANKFEVQVVALDKFTGVFRKLNNSASQAVRPLSNIGRQTGALMREMHMPQAMRGIRGLAKAGQELSSSMGSAGSSMGALFGLGAAGGVVATVAAVGQLASSWANLGANVLQSSKLMGVNAQELQKWQAAAKLTGATAEDMTSTLGNLAKTQQDARFGRNLLASSVMAKFGINSRDPSGGLMDVSRVMASIPSAQTRISLAESLGISPSLIPLLARGPAAIRGFMGKGGQLGMVQGDQDLQAAEQARIDTALAGGLATGITNKIGQILMPGLGRRIKNVTEALTDNTPAAPLTPEEEAAASKPAFVAPRMGRRAPADGGSKVEINVNIPNAPKGTSVTATHAGEPVKIHRNMSEQ